MLKLFRSKLVTVSLCESLKKTNGHMKNDVIAQARELNYMSLIERVNEMR